MGKAVFHLSAGGVVVTEGEEGPLALVLATERYGKKRWCLPKGHVEEGEATAEAARREVEEEAGIKGVRVLERLGDVRYFFRLPGDDRLQFKVVQFFLMELPGGPQEPSPDAKEGFVDGRWIPLGEAERVLTYKGEREILRKAAQAWTARG